MPAVLVTQPTVRQNLLFLSTGGQTTQVVILPIHKGMAMMSWLVFQGDCEPEESHPFHFSFDHNDFYHRLEMLLNVASNTTMHFV